MPKKKVTVTYLCEICSSEYGNKEGALECEKGGIAVPEFKRFEVAELVGFSDKEQNFVEASSGLKFEVRNGMKVVVQDCGGVSSSINPHLLPFYYEVWFYPGSPFKKHLVSFSRENIRKIAIKNGTICPLCSRSAFTTDYIFGPVLTLGSGLPFLRNIPIQGCCYCEVKFFTTQQLKKVELFIKKNTKWPLANTRRLVEELRFQH